MFCPSLWLGTYSGFSNHVDFEPPRPMASWGFCRPSIKTYEHVPTKSRTSTSVKGFESFPASYKMVRSYGISLRWRVVFLHVIHHTSAEDIANILSVGRSYVQKVLKLYRETKGVNDNTGLRRGRPRIIDGNFRFAVCLCSCYYM